MRAGVFLFLILFASLASAVSCEADVDTVYLSLSVREYIGGGIFVPVTDDNLELYEYTPVYNNTRIYLSGFDSSDLCSASCTDERPTEFTANFAVVTEKNGRYDITEVFSIEEGEESPQIYSEGRNFTFIASGFWSKLSCDEFEDEDFDYCLDGTRRRKCSYTRPYRCIEDENDDLTLQYQPGFCGKPEWLVYSEGCAYGEYTFCDPEINSVMRRTCENSQWLTVFVEDCGKAKCLFNATNAYCSDVPSNTCPDGTLKGGCSKDKPYYCNDNAILIENPKICGCPANADYEPSTLSCIYLECDDSTKVGECSGPLYCDSDGEFVVKASVCGCPTGYLVDDDSCVLEPEENVTAAPEPEPANETVEDVPQPAPEPEPVTVESSTTTRTPTGLEGVPLDIFLGTIFIVVVLFVAYIFFKH